MSPKMEESSQRIPCMKNIMSFCLYRSSVSEEDSHVSEQDIVAHLDRNFEKDEIVEGQETYLCIVTEDNLLILLYYFIVSS
ncbi:hypothetical protein RclHR1_11590008 [Rhizophagus clarus]|uniref:Uncharacterized protein n=1 Tax=Rhizophagus clarus TaxID=94130 RepID=A0A2Z6QJR0_9GLOM|nr:hypothetical protein RclHR1_11590008 [Rhizophagus clarus]